MTSVGDDAALAAMRVAPHHRTAEQHAAVRRWSERSVKLPGETSHEQLSTVMTLEEHPERSLLFRQGATGDSFYVVYSGQVGMYLEPEAPEDSAVAMISAAIKGRITRRIIGRELQERREARQRMLRGSVRQLSVMQSQRSLTLGGGPTHGADAQEAAVATMVRQSSSVTAATVAAEEEGEAAATSEQAAGPSADEEEVGAEGGERQTSGLSPDVRRRLQKQASEWAQEQESVAALRRQALSHGGSGAAFAGSSPSSPPKGSARKLVPSQDARRRSVLQASRKASRGSARLSLSSVADQALDPDSVRAAAQQVARRRPRGPEGGGCEARGCLGCEGLW